jgi:hypothetical protein
MKNSKTGKSLLVLIITLFVFTLFAGSASANPLPYTSPWGPNPPSWSINPDPIYSWNNNNWNNGWGTNNPWAVNPDPGYGYTVKNHDNPQTADASNLVLWASLAAASIVCVVVVGKKRTAFNK